MSRMFCRLLRLRVASPLVGDVMIRVASPLVGDVMSHRAPPTMSGATSAARKRSLFQPARTFDIVSVLLDRNSAQAKAYGPSLVKIRASI